VLPAESAAWRASDATVIVSLSAVLGDKSAPPQQLHADAGLNGDHVLPGVSWTADSTRLLIPIADNSGQPVAFRTYDLTTQSLSAVGKLPAVSSRARRILAWGPDANSVVVADTQADGTAQQLRFSGLNGTAVRSETLPAGIRPALSNDRWLFSPDGRYLNLVNGSALDSRDGEVFRIVRVRVPSG
jgi:hypothetical protein